MRTLILCATLAIGCSASAAFAEANANSMMEQCQAYVVQHMHVPPGVVNVKFEGQRTDGTFAVNGDTETNPKTTFQCNFHSNGKGVAHFWRNVEGGCPADVSQADRYKYPACN